MKPQILYPLAISFSLHGLIFALFVWPIRLPEPRENDVDTARPPLRITIRRSTQPQGGPIEVASEAGESDPTPGNVTQTASATRTPRVLTLPRGETGPDDPPQTAGNPVSEPTDNAPVVQSAQVISDAVNNVMDRRSSDFQDCSPRQRRSELFNCEEESTVDYERLTQNSTYAYFMPRTEPDMTRPAIDRLAADATQIRERLEAVGHETLKVDGFLQQLQESAGARTSTTQSQRMRDMLFLNDDTHQLRKQVMGQSPVSLQQ